uniref:Ig-like domain-containing protein n=1 Tax=Poecilia mexicana TaxID=48701 RepID=A0A3B3XPP5_9TELE
MSKICFLVLNTVFNFGHAQGDVTSFFYLLLWIFTLILLLNLFQLNMFWHNTSSLAFIFYILCFLLFNLDVQLTHDPSSSTLFLGESVTFTCNMTAGYDSNWSYVFHRNGQHIVSKSDVSKFLQLDRTTDLSGRYQCSAYHKDSPGFIKQSNNITLSVAANRPTPTVTADRKTISEDRPTELTCSVQDSAGWKYDWFRHIFSEVQIESNVVKNTINIHRGGIYWCRGRRGSPDFLTEPSEMFYIENTLSNQATVALQHDWSQIYSGEAISMSCEIKGGGNSKWEYEWRTTTSKPPSRERTFHIRASVFSSGDFWCRGRADPFSSTEWSQTCHLRVSDKPRPTVRADKRLIPVGGNVTLTCSVDNPTEWKYYWFRHTGNISEVQTVDEGKSENVISISQGGVYYCQGGRGSPVFFTEESHRINIEKREQRPKAQIIADRDSTGGTMTLTCSVKPSSSSSSSWTYYWYRVEIASKPVELKSDTNGELVTSENGLYFCRAGRGRPVYYTESSQSVTVDIPGRCFNELVHRFLRFIQKIILINFFL